MIQLDELQLQEADADSPAYSALSGIKKDLDGALDLINGRFDLIQKADSSKVGWSAAVHYEKSNGPLIKAESGKLWAEAEKQVLEAKKVVSKDKSPSMPFRSWPASGGRFQSQRTARGSYWLHVFST